MERRTVSREEVVATTFLVSQMKRISDFLNDNIALDQDELVDSLLPNSDILEFLYFFNPNAEKIDLAEFWGMVDDPDMTVPEIVKALTNG